MLEDALLPYMHEMKDRHKLGFIDSERAYCVGIVAGLLRYDTDGGNEFRDWCPDDPCNLAEETVDEWAKQNPDCDQESLKRETGLLKDCRYDSSHG
jgi:hypothetical protein